MLQFSDLIITNNNLSNTFTSLWFTKKKKYEEDTFSNITPQRR